MIMQREEPGSACPGLVAPAGTDALALASSSSRWASRILISTSAADMSRLPRRIARALARVEYATWAGSLILERSSSASISPCKTGGCARELADHRFEQLNLPRHDVGNPVNHVWLPPISHVPSESPGT